MRDRFEQILRIACLALAALAVLQLIHAGFQASRLVGVKIPAVPVLETNSVSTTNSAAAKNQMTNAMKPNLVATNVLADKTNLTVLTNTATASAVSTNQLATNEIVRSGTNKFWPQPKPIPPPSTRKNQNEIRRRKWFWLVA